MRRVVFTLGSTDARGRAIVEQEIVEAGFANDGQAHAWLADGARKRYGRTFWNRVQKISIEHDAPIIGGE